MIYKKVSTHTLIILVIITSSSISTTLNEFSIVSSIWVSFHKFDSLTLNSYGIKK